MAEREGESEATRQHATQSQMAAKCKRIIVIHITFRIINKKYYTRRETGQGAR